MTRRGVAVVALFVLADLTTARGNGIGIVTASGLAAAEWPAFWGRPEQIVFYEANGAVTYGSTF